jgi:hypothetical protein
MSDESDEFDRLRRQIEGYVLEAGENIEDLNIRRARLSRIKDELDDIERRLDDA